MEARKEMVDDMTKGISSLTMHQNVLAHQRTFQSSCPARIVSGFRVDNGRRLNTQIQRAMPLEKHDIRDNRVMGLCYRIIRG